MIVRIIVDFVKRVNTLEVLRITLSTCSLFIIVIQGNLDALSIWDLQASLM